MNSESIDSIYRSISSMINNGSTCIDALIEYSNRNNIEIEMIASMVKKSDILYEVIKKEAQKNHLLIKEKNKKDLEGFF
jgi:hypothetical protein